ncbi:tRNA (N(6)-L-threonylcarbamoyladenosine(37)-C(2))-methylthiotransferase MtaB [Parvicella tangerina]|uniref:Threonylcarbamoyladenosine tRNA methylthiotransferase MtaB n=1 Tax=Parvicella tangerina TaxID=2829795 RepID=A0A916JNL3_9FLAO|nr:tRNA (N(6)-L-threonylcarbamoyladenosine(37)-C(2))-methylthiotransferase MtaB [Parvicella tangerina]CAG5081136.1 Threonylcarbamoyladenosine tRNA methylthiotransferase MtaB [Parvicella tangerina]
MNYGTAAYYTLGCKLNFSETSTISQSLAKEGFAKIPFEDGADVYVINTCSVTEQANKKCRSIVRKALSYNPDAFIAVIGCYAQLKPKEIAEIEGVDVVLGANEKFNITDYLGDLSKHEETTVKNEEIKHTKEFVPGYSIGDRTRSFLKVQDGCNYFCAFCTIPLARGRGRNASVTETVQKAKELAKTNVKEVVLTGVNIGDFGYGTDENFLDLIKELDRIEGIERFRISSIEPNLLSDEIIEFVANSKRFVPHFHIPLQSGSDKLLEKMRRRYDTDLYRSRIAKIKQLMPDCCIGVDVIVGFPGETDEEFQKTYDLLHELPISYLHVFTYSERPNTTAIRMDGVVPVHVRKERNKKLSILSSKKKRAFYESQNQQREIALFESSESEGMMYGFTSNYVKVKTPFNPLMINESSNIKLTELDRDGVYKIEFVEEKLETITLTN